MVITPKKQTSSVMAIDLAGWRKITTLSEQTLVESLDYRPTLTDVTDDFNPPSGLYNFRVHKTELGDHLISFEKDGVVEIHHATKDDVSGRLIGGKTPNSRFVSCMFHLGKEFVDSGKTVRVIAPDEMIEKYHRIATKLKDRGNFSLSSVVKAHEGHGQFFLTQSSISKAKNF